MALPFTEVHGVYGVHEVHGVYGVHGVHDLGIQQMGSADSWCVLCPVGSQFFVYASFMWACPTKVSGSP